jgi:hypothetical protein
VEILLWLVPSAVVTLAAMLWVSWVSRDGRGEIDRDVAVERLGKALSKELPTGTHGTSPRVRDRSTGIAVRPSHGAGRAGDATRRAS